MIEQHASLAEKFLKKGFWLYLFSFIIAPIGYIIKILISGELSVEEVGILYGIISLITLLAAYNDLGMTESLKHFIPKFITEKRYDKVKTILFLALFTQIISSIIIAIFFFFGADFIAEHYFKTNAAKEILKVFAFFFLGLNIFQTINQFFMSVQDTFYHKFSELLRMCFIMFSVLFIFFGDVSSLLHYSYSWLIGLYVGILFILCIFYMKYYKKYFSNEKIHLDKTTLSPIIKYASLVFIGASAGTILGQMDMQMVIYILGVTQAGYYTNYLSIISIPFMLIGPIFAFLFPVISELYSKKQYSKIKIIKEIFIKNFILIGIMSNTFLFIFSETIAYILFGEKFIESGIILKYSVLLLTFNFLLQINFNILSGIGKVADRVKIIFIAVIFNFIGNIILINQIGVYGAALATGLGWILIYILSEYFLGKKYKVYFDTWGIIKNVLLIGGIGVIIYSYSGALFEGLSRFKSLIGITLFFIIYFIFFIVINHKDFKKFIKEIKFIKKPTS